MHHTDVLVQPTFESREAIFNKNKWDDVKKANPPGHHFFEAGLLLD